MRDAGSALMGIGLRQRREPGRRGGARCHLVAAARGAVEGATGILLNITGGTDLGLFEVNEAAEIIGSASDADANIIFGAVIDEAMGDKVRVTVIATGFDRRHAGSVRRGALATGRASRTAAPGPADCGDQTRASSMCRATCSRFPSFLRDQ